MSMRSLVAALLLASLALVPAASFAQTATPTPATAGAATLTYPPAPSDATVDDYYGTKVPDPYRPLESIDAPATRAWVGAEATLTRTYLDAIPQRAAIRAHLKAIANYERFTAPFHMRDRYFYFYNTGLQDQSVLYTTQGLHGAPHVFIDPNKLSADGSVTISGEQPSWNAKLLAYATQSSGSDWQTWHVRSIATGKDLPDTLQWSKFAGASWLADDSGFFYERYPAPGAGETYKSALYGQSVYLHLLGTPQSADTLVYFRPDHKNWLYGAGVSEDGRYLVVGIGSNDSINNRVGYIDLRDSKRTMHQLLWKNDAQWNYIDNVGPVFYFTTTLGAPNTRLMAIDLRKPAAMRTIVPESKFALQNVSAVGHRFVLSYLVDAHSAVKVYDYRGAFVRDVSLPGLGSANGFAGYSTDRITFYGYSGWTTPPAIFTYDVVSGESAVYRKPRIAFNATDYTTKEIFYTSKDGTHVPMMISYRNGLVLDGTNPTILYGYGGFDIPMTPYFSTFIATWLQMGGVYAVANMRGGSEYGEAWHMAGMLGKKQNVFDDFIAAAEYLIAQKYTSTPKLAVKGESNGGLLIGAVETQRPDLMGVALPGVGVLDMLRFDKFTIGNAWISEYGCSTCGKADFDWLRAYSPLHNVKPGTKYPPTLIMTSDHDDRVFPAHSFKFAATMQAAQAGPAPVLLRVQQKAGHGGSTTLAEAIDEYADIYAFVVKNLNMTLPAAFGGP
jgi:prolyl oligopeptidase